MARLTMRVDGLQATTRKLEELPRKLQKTAIGKSLTAASGPPLKAARRLCPRASGLTARSLAKRRKSYRGGAVQVEIIGQKSEVKNRKKLKLSTGGISGRGGVVPLHLIERPTRAHRIPLRDYTLRQIETTKAFRDARRSAGKEFRLYKRVWRDKPLAIPVGGGLIFRWHAQHPGTSGQHFLRTAGESTTGLSIDQFERKLREQVDAAASSS